MIIKTNLQNMMVAIKAYINGKVNDSITVLDATWSSSKISQLFTTINNSISALINDSATASNSTWSSQRINTVVGAADYNKGEISASAIGSSALASGTYTFDTRTITLPSGKVLAYPTLLVSKGIGVDSVSNPTQTIMGIDEGTGGVSIPVMYFRRCDHNDGWKPFEQVGDVDNMTSNFDAAAYFNSL